MFSLAAVAEGKSDMPLAGRWTYQHDGKASELVLDASGNGSLDGALLYYKVQGNLLYVSINGGLQAYSFQFVKSSLTIQGGDLAQAVTFTRATQSSNKGAQGAKNTQSGNTNNDKALSQLLLANDWCSSSYSGGGGGYNSSGSYGHSSTSRVHFSPDGNVFRSSGSESSSGNQYGSVASQGNRGDGGRWKVSGGMLYLSSGNEPMQPVSLSVTRNSNGYPIVKSNGIEYMQCN
jgi:hypothetical protein